MTYYIMLIGNKIISNTISPLFDSLFLHYVIFSPSLFRTDYFHVEIRGWFKNTKN